MVKHLAAVVGVVGLLTAGAASAASADDGPRWRMPRLDGLAAIRRIAESVNPAPAVVALTTFDVDEYLFGALQAGAAGFVLKDSEPRCSSKRCARRRRDRG